MANQPARLVADYQLPPYAFLPGYAPHPERQPGGHMRGDREASEPSPTPLDTGLWPHNRTYLLGVDLFNYGYYWEAHEKWEALWLLASDEQGVASFLKGLIKLAAAGVKIRVGNARGTGKHAERACRLFGSVMEQAGTNRFAGLWLPDLYALGEWARRNAKNLPASAGRTPQIVYDMVLWPYQE